MQRNAIAMQRNVQCAMSNVQNNGPKTELGDLEMIK